MPPLPLRGSGDTFRARGYHYKTNQMNNTTKTVLAVSALLLIAARIPQSFGIIRVFWSRQKALIKSPFGIQLIDLSKPEVIKANSKFVLMVMSTISVEGEPAAVYIQLIDKTTGQTTEATIRYSNKTVEIQQFESQTTTAIIEE